MMMYLITLTLVVQLLHEASFGTNSPLGKVKYFSSSSVNKLTGNDILEYKQETFNTQNLIVTSNGLPADEVRQWTEDAFAQLPSGKKANLSAQFVGGEIRQRADINTTLVGVAYHVPVGQGNQKKEYMLTF